MSSEPLVHLTRDVVRQNSLITKGDRILIAASGGIDSMVLLDVLYNLQEEFGCDLGVVHINHHLRGGESDGDEEFVKSAAGHYHLPCHTKSVDIGELAREEKRSVQDIAREIRYRYFHDLRNDLGFRAVATAHHADDNAETMLFNMIRGSGIHGLTGIPMKHRDTGIIRPFLTATRKEIARYALEKSIRYREDSSNAKTEYTRNLIRHRLIPVIREEINPGLSETMTRMSLLFTGLEEFLSGLYREAKNNIILRDSSDEIIIDGSKFGLLAPFMREFFLFSLVKEFTKGDIESGIVREMIKITQSGTGSRCSVSDRVIFSRNRDELILACTGKGAPFSYTVEINRAYDFAGFQFRSAVVDSVKFSEDPFIEYIDSETVNAQMTLRSWKDGDWFIPLGMTEKRKLSDFFIDEKIPLFEKKSIPILESGGKIVWICGKRLDDRHKITSATRHYLKLEYRPRPDKN